jgi:hypothetical protein
MCCEFWQNYRASLLLARSTRKRKFRDRSSFVAWSIAANRAAFLPFFLATGAGPRDYSIFQVWGWSAKPSTGNVANLDVFDAARSGADFATFQLLD